MAPEYFAGYPYMRDEDLSGYKDAFGWDTFEGGEISGTLDDAAPPAFFQHRCVGSLAIGYISGLPVCTTRPPPPITPGKYLCNCGMAIFVWDGKALTMDFTQQALASAGR